MDQGRHVALYAPGCPTSGQNTRLAPSHRTAKRTAPSAFYDVRGNTNTDEFSKKFDRFFKKLTFAGWPMFWPIIRETESDIFNHLFKYLGQQEAGKLSLDAPKQRLRSIPARFPSSASTSPSKRSDSISAGSQT